MKAYFVEKCKTTVVFGRWVFIRIHERVSRLSMSRDKRTSLYVLKHGFFLVELAGKEKVLVT